MALQAKDITVTLPSPPAVREGHISQGAHESPTGHTLSLNSLCYLRDGEPWYPVMGEMHYTRVPRSEWDEEVLKMKSSGVSVIATYVFWIHHEEKQGEYRWDGDRDLHEFLQVCQRHGMYVWLRIGPWCHGEARNGGFPDWIMGIEGGLRKDNPLYLEHVRRLFSEIGRQTQGMCFAQGGPIIGVQVENEYAFDTEERLSHLLHLKRMAVEAGLDVPYYTATGWPRSDLRQTEFIPVWGGYPEAPWSSSTKELSPSANYVFSSWAGDSGVGTDLLGDQESATSSALQYPYSTAEMGGGNQPTYHRRPLITEADVVSQSYVKVGSGANMMGYYMYHGGHNPMGELSTMQESKATKYPNDYAILNYDFFSPIGEWGQVRPSFFGLKVLHAFLADYGSRLATTVPTFCGAEDAKDISSLRLCVRSDGQGGYVFVNNYQRLLDMEEQRDVSLRIRRQDGEETLFPTFSVAKGEQLIFPFRLRLGKHILDYATAQPLWALNDEVPTYVFFSRGSAAQFSFSATNTANAMLDGTPVSQSGGSFIVSCSPEREHLITLYDGEGGQTRLLVLTTEQARTSYKVSHGGREILCLSPSCLTQDGDTLCLTNAADPRFRLSVYPADVPLLPQGMSGEEQGCFRTYCLDVEAVELEAVLEPEDQPERHVPSQLLYPEDDRREEVPATCPGPQYFVNFRPVPSSLYYTVSLPTLPSSVKAAYLSVDYVGDTASMYEDGELVADDFYTGEPMMFKLPAASAARQLLLQIIPLPPEVQIYLSPSAREKMERQPQGVNSVSLVPVYELRLSL